MPNIDFWLWQASLVFAKSPCDFSESGESQRKMKERFFGECEYLQDYGEYSHSLIQLIQTIIKIDI
jgi:hypothetical protein